MDISAISVMILIQLKVQDLHAINAKIMIFAQNVTNNKGIIT
jgi:hypothetical protein